MINESAFIKKLTLIITLYMFSVQVYPQSKPREMIKNTMIDYRTNGVEPQLMDNSCGIASLAYVFNMYFNKSTSEKNLFFFIGLKPEYSLLDLFVTSKKFGISSVGLKLTMSDLENVNSPTILKTKTNGGHFIVYTGSKNGWFQVIDPARGKLNYFKAELSKLFIDPTKGYGTALIFLSENKNNFIEKKLYKNNTNRLWLERSY